MPDTAPLAGVGHLRQQTEQPDGNQRPVITIVGVILAGARVFVDGQSRR